MSTASQVWRAWFQPPRAHGEVDETRSVSFVELFYDLVFVVLVGRIAHALGAHISWHALWEYAVVFALVWFAWMNGTLYHELHGRPDGRSRMYIFGQMAWLVLLAVFAGHAATDNSDGRAFAIVFAILLVQLMYQWAAILPHDAPEFRPVVVRYVVTIGIAAATSLASAFVSSPATRLWIWTALVIATLISVIYQISSSDDRIARATRMTHSMSERFALYIILVLGEVVIGVVNGMTEAGTTTIGIVTGMIALAIGFGFWWTYFDFIALRRAASSRSQSVWMHLHLPLSAAIAASGAAITALIEHAAETDTPATVGWLLAGSVAVVLVSEAIILMALPARPGLEQVPLWLAGGAAIAIGIGWWAPRPWLFALLLNVPLSMVWFHALFASSQRGYLVNGEPLT